MTAGQRTCSHAARLDDAAFRSHRQTRGPETPRPKEGSRERPNHRYDFRCPEERFWELYLDPAWIVRMLTEGLGYTGCRVLRNEETPTGLSRDLVMTPRLNLPGPVAKVIGPSTTITEEGRFDRTTRTWSWKHRLSTMADKFLIGGSMRVAPNGAGQITRQSEVTLECKIFGIGGLVENAAAGDIRSGFAAGADFINRYLAAERSSSTPTRRVTLGRTL